MLTFVLVISLLCRPCIVLRDVWIRTRSAALTTRLATNLAPLFNFYAYCRVTFERLISFNNCRVVFSQGDRLADEPARNSRGFSQQYRKDRFPTVQVPDLLFYSFFL